MTRNSTEILLSLENRDKTKQENTLRKIPPEIPSQVFLGETKGDNGVFPINDPINKHPLSVCQAAVTHNTINPILSLFHRYI